MQEFWLWIGIERSVSVPVNVLQMRLIRIELAAVLFGLIGLRPFLDWDKLGYGLK